MNKTIMKLEFNESLSDSSIKLIQKMLKESLGYDTEIISIKEGE